MERVFDLEADLKLRQQVKTANLDSLGRLYDIPRKSGEDDDAYSARLRSAILQSRGEEGHQ
jgi:hypothetical protein